MCLGWVFSIYSQLYQPFSDGAVGLAASMLNSQFAMPFRAQVGPVNVVCVHVCSFHQSISKQKHKTGKSLSTLMHAWKVCPSLRDEITTHDLFVIMVSLLPNKYPMIYLQVLHYLLWTCSPLPPSKAQEKLLPVGKWPGMQVWPLCVYLWLCLCLPDRGASWGPHAADVLGGQLNCTARSMLHRMAHQLHIGLCLINQDCCSRQAGLHFPEVLLGFFGFLVRMRFRLSWCTGLSLSSPRD